MKNLAMILLVAAAPALNADGLSDLRASLGKLTASEPVRTAITLDTTSRSDDDEPLEVGKAAFEAEHGPQGLRISYSSDLVSRAAQEARAAENDPEKPTPTRTATRQVDPVDLIELIDAGGAMARSLDTAKLVKDLRINSGRAVRQLTFSLHPKLSKSDAKRVKEFDVTLVVNLDAEGTPVSADMKQHMKIKFLLISFQTDQQENWVFTKAGNRLLAARYQQRSKGSGMGQNFESTKAMTLAMK